MIREQDEGNRHDGRDQSGRRPRRLQAMRAGNLRILALGSEPEGEALARQFLRQGWNLRRTSHFLALQRQEKGLERILVHWLKSEESDNRLVDYLQQELVRIGWLEGEEDFNAALNGLIASFAPTAPLEAWRRFALNTFAQLSKLIAPAPPTTVAPIKDKDSGESIAAFAAIYRRLLTLLQGSSLLDVGCACAYWPLLVAQGGQCAPRSIVAVDRRAEALRLSLLLSEALGLTDRLHFMQLDLLQPEFLGLGAFDTVTAIHLLEHLEENELPHALDQLLHVTRRRLLIVVPYEERAQECYGHRQIFSTAKLQFWGQWCLDRLEGRASYWCEDLLGGLLVIERFEGPDSQEPVEARGQQGQGAESLAGSC
ncbi:methyltransferase domain-containing protein [Thermogemmatispora sp.]|uniref:methyltransferase domain-containing protein n=1 Tax=Thermogemmatispora sp. TaxID=1968838 RepID=UPI001D282795|nr:methyltransferase domain-containing protein [Thermogemmatispora sp.]MBX5451683.1 methyltransferase domain-containing protein [Thermogemmatispora sp.]